MPGILRSTRTVSLLTAELQELHQEATESRTSPHQEGKLVQGQLNRMTSVSTALLMVRYSFIFSLGKLSIYKDDLPVIRDNIKKGFLETQSKVNSWVNNLRKKIDGEEDSDHQGSSARNPQGSSGRPQYHDVRRSGELGRRSADRDRYDADPQILGDDFAGLQMRDNEGKSFQNRIPCQTMYSQNPDSPRRPTRPLANPDLFKPTLPRSQSGNGRRVSFQEGPPAEIDTPYRASPDFSKRPSPGAGKSNKWQPLAAVDPSPVADHDPFSLGDSDDEDAKKKDLRADDSERLKEAAAKATGEKDGSMQKALEPHQQSGSSGTRDAEAEKLTTKT